MYNENHSSMELCLKSQNSLFVSFFSHLPKAYVTNFRFTAGFSRMCSKLSKQILWYFQKRVANNKYYNQIDLNMKRKNNIFAKSTFFRRKSRYACGIKNETFSRWRSTKILKKLLFSPKNDSTILIFHLISRTWRLLN